MTSSVTRDTKLCRGEREENFIPKPPPCQPPPLLPSHQLGVGVGGVTHNTTKDDKTPDQKQLLPGCLFWTGQHLSLPTLNYPNVTTSSCYHIEWPGKPGLPGYTGAGTLINKQYLPSKTQSYQEPPSQNMALLNSMPPLRLQTRA